MAKHRISYRQWINNKKKYLTAFEILKYDDCYIDLLEIVNFDSKDVLYNRENHFIRKMDSVNKNSPGAYITLGRQAYNKKYHKDNLDLRHAYKNKKNKCQCGGRYTNARKARHYKTNLHREWLLEKWSEFNHL
jgi:hypothetical protein